jgi:ATP-dependent Clp protease ATP-binding subunit ClpA
MTFSDEVEAVLNRAFAAASEAGHPEITPEHVALELIVEDETATYLARCGTDLVAVESRLRDYLGGIEPSDAAEERVQPDDALERVVEAAMQRAEDDDRDHLMLRDLFLALIDERDSTASIAIIEATREPEVFEDLRAYPWEDDE